MKPTNAINWRPIAEAPRESWVYMLGWCRGSVEPMRWNDRLGGGAWQDCVYGSVIAPTHFAIVNVPIREDKK